MQALIDFIAGLVALLAAATLSHFGVEVGARGGDREVQRISDCGDGGSAPAAVASVVIDKAC